MATPSAFESDVGVKVRSVATAAAAMYGTSTKMVALTFRLPAVMVSSMFSGQAVAKRRYAICNGDGLR